MDELVRKILNIENKANRMIEDEKQRLSDLSKDVEEILDVKRNEMEEKSRLRIDRLTESESEDEARRIAKLEAEFLENTEKLTKTIEQNKEKWVDEIFNRIIS